MPTQPSTSTCWSSCSASCSSSAISSWESSSTGQPSGSWRAAVFGGAALAWLGGRSLPLVAITAGAVMVAVAQRDPAYAIDRVEWSLLLFFASLFVVMRGFEQTGAVAWLDDHAVRVVQGGSPWRAAVVVSGVMATLSDLISNVPAGILWRNTVPAIPNPDLMWRVLAMSSPFPGNLLLIAP